MLKPPRPSERYWALGRARGVRARGRGRSGAHLTQHPRGSNPIRRHASGYPTEGHRRPRPFPTLSSPLVSILALCPISHPQPVLHPRGAECARARARLSAIKRRRWRWRPCDRTRKSSTTAAQMNGMPTYAWYSRLIGCPLLPGWKRTNERAEPSWAERDERARPRTGLRCKRQGPRPYHSMASFCHPPAPVSLQNPSQPRPYRVCNCTRSARLRGRVRRILVENWNRSFLHRNLIGRLISAGILEILIFDVLLIMTRVENVERLSKLI